MSQPQLSPPEYDSPGGLIAGSVIMWIVSTLCVGLRFYSKRWKRQGYITADWLILVAAVFATGMTVMEIYGVKEQALGYPLGASIEDPKAVNGRLNKAKHIELSFLLLGIATLGLIKLSVCFLFWHLFARVVFRRFLMVWIAVIIVWALSFVLAGLLECGSHLKALFGQPQAYLDHCGSAIPTGYAMVGSDVATDFITLLIPIPVIFSMKMDRRTRFLTLLTFMIGALSVGASIAKAYIYIKASLGLWTSDAISMLTGLSIWNLAEVHIGIVAACGPTLRPILARILPTESLLSLMSLLGVSSNTSKQNELPSFVKMPEADSAEQLQPGVEKVGSKGADGPRGVRQYEMESWNDAESERRGPHHV
ncbi:hypothetical protein QR685DRAFT_111036 [Neurospora intermedia]|uniref:Rhodopsin domain-containing protein n=1 Tax=Neurospora intermedia TaxID=5142 RepID=A0ABR3D269_NEUIN